MANLVLETSVVIALIRKEPGWQALSAALDAGGQISLSAASFVECSIVLQRGSFSTEFMGELTALLKTFAVVVVPVDEAQARLAAEAYAIYGKGRHPAALNFGDCFSYALAKYLKQPLLFKGNDFAQTDVQVALPA